MRCRREPATDIARMFLVAWLGIATPLMAASAAPDILVSNAWSRATPPGADVGVVFFEVQNAAATADALLSIDTPVARHVEMHESRTVDGIMQMRQTLAAQVPAHGTLRFQPGGLHAMLLGLQHPLRRGDTLALTLTFRHAGRVVISAPVQDVGATAPALLDSKAAADIDERFRLAEWPANLAVPEFALTDDAGRPRSSTDYRGRLVLLFFGFTHCPDVCPAGLFKLAQVYRQLPAPRAEVQVLFVTLDPARDSPSLLQRYVRGFDASFVGLTGSSAAINAAAASFHVEYAKVGAGKEYTIDHSTGVFVLDGTGRLRLVGSTATPSADFVHDLKLLAKRSK